MKRALVLWVSLAACVAACGDNDRLDVTIVSGGSAAWGSAMTEYVQLMPAESEVTLDAVDAPDAQIADDTGAWRILLVDDAAIPAEGYLLAHPSAHTLVGHAHDVLGAQYAASEALEDLGYRFRHPTETYVPPRPVLDAGAVFDVVHQPQIRTRGLHLHTLHPIEGYFALWEPSDANLADARATIDWIVKNRGNYLQWVALNDILDATKHAAWQPFERSILDDAHARGVRTGLNVEMFSSGNLQLAYDLVDVADQTAYADQIDANLHPVLDGLPWDVVAISYGEFFDEPAQSFIDANNALAASLRAQAPGTELHAVIHVGATQRATYENVDLPYYQLVRFADPSIEPDIHSVMYFDLFQPADGAYQQTSFAEHEAYLVQQLCAGKRAGYHPELAYWVAFDDSVPTFLPLYVRSRWLDLEDLRHVAPPPCAPLDAHVMFSSGDEWGYWLQNVTGLHDSYEHAPTVQRLFDDALSPDFGASGAQLVGDLSEAQNRALIGQALGAYMAGRDAVIDTGRQLDIISQPDRVTFDQLPMMSPDQLTAFEASVLAPLDAHAAELDGFAARFAALDLDVSSRWVRELRDGLDVDRARAHFVAACYHAVIAQLGGDDATSAAQRATAADELATGTAVIAARHADLHDAHGTRLTARTPNDTSYGYGYLYQADSACYWRRELVQVDNALGTSTATPPDCFL